MIGYSGTFQKDFCQIFRIIARAVVNKNDFNALFGIVALLDVSNSFPDNQFFIISRDNYADIRISQGSRKFVRFFTKINTQQKNQIGEKGNEEKQDRKRKKHPVIHFSMTDLYIIIFSSPESSENLKIIQKICIGFERKLC